MHLLQLYMKIYERGLGKTSEDTGLTLKQILFLGISQSARLAIELLTCGDFAERNDIFVVFEHTSKLFGADEYRCLKKLYVPFLQCMS